MIRAFIKITEHPNGALITEVDPGKPGTKRENEKAAVLFAALKLAAQEHGKTKAFSEMFEAEPGHGNEVFDELRERLINFKPKE